MTPAQARAIGRGIVEPNTSGQGAHAEAMAVPYRWRIEKAGWVYSHTTAVVVDGESYELHHTFRRGDHAITFWRHGRDNVSRYWRGCWRWSGSWGGSGREVVGLVDVAIGPEPIVRYLAGVSRRARKLDRPGFAKAGGDRE